MFFTVLSESCFLQCMDVLMTRIYPKDRLVTHNVQLSRLYQFIDIIKCPRSDAHLFSNSAVQEGED